MNMFLLMLHLFDRVLLLIRCLIQFKVLQRQPTTKESGTVFLSFIPAVAI